MNLETAYNYVLAKTKNGKVCPAHEDDHGSLSVDQVEDRILLKCHAGCEFKKIVAALGMRSGDFFEKPQNRKKAQQKETARYRYDDEDSRHLFDVVRFEPQKTFRQQAADGKWTTKHIKKVPYQLPQLLNAIQSGEKILVLEGEKDVIKAKEMGFVATTFPGGAGKWRKEYLEYFKKAEIVLIPDLDKPGIEGANKIALGLNGTVKSINWLHLPGLGEVKPKHGKDFFDWTELPDSTPEKLSELVDSSPIWKPMESQNLNQIAKYGGGWFRVSDNAVHYQPPLKITKNGEVEPSDEIWICSRLSVEAYTRSSKSDSWGRLLLWKDPDGAEHKWACPAELLEADGAELRRELAHRGLRIAPSRKARELLLAYLKVWSVEHRARCVEKLGWFGSVYVTAIESIGATEVEQVVFQSDSTLQSASACSGSLESWKNTVARWARGNSRVLFSLSCAAAGPLLSISGGEPGGFHMRGPSSCGKTTLLHAAASFSGPPSGVVRSWRATANGLEGVAALHNDGTLLLDELSQISPDDAAAASYMLANGQAKQRASRTGAARRSLNWQLLFLSSGEESLSALMGRIRKRPNPGAEIRMLDIPAESSAGFGVFEKLHEFNSGGSLSLSMKEATAVNHGMPGRTWLKWVVENRSALAEQLPKNIHEFCLEYIPANASGQVERSARRFALVAAAGELLTGIGITGWAEGEAENAAVCCFEDWLKDFGGGQRETENVLRQVKLFLEQHGDSRFEPMENIDNRRTVNNRAGFWRTVTEGKEFLVFPEVFKEEVCAGIDHKHAAKVLKDAGWLKSFSNRLTCCVRLPGMPVTRVYQFCSKVWEDTDDTI